MNELRGSLKNVPEEKHRVGEPFVWSRHARYAGRIAGLRFLSYCLGDEIGVVYGRNATLRVSLLEALADKVEGTEGDSDIFPDSGNEHVDDLSRLLVRLASGTSQDNPEAQINDQGDSPNKDSVAYYLFRDRRRLAGRIAGLQFFLFCLVDTIAGVLGRSGVFELQLLDRLADDFERIATDSSIDRFTKEGAEEVYSDYARLHAGRSIGEYAEQYCEKTTDPYGIERRVAPEERARS